MFRGLPQEVSLFFPQTAINGCFSTTVSLPAGQSYRFRYLLDGNACQNYHLDSFMLKGVFSLKTS